MDRAVIRALLFPLCTWVLYGFQPEGVRLPDDCRLIICFNRALDVDDLPINQKVARDLRCREPCWIATKSDGTLTLRGQFLLSILLLLIEDNFGLTSIVDL